MKFFVEVLGGLKRRLNVTLPSELFEKKVKKQLKEIAPKANFRGFRPGKVPLRELQRRYGDDVRRDVAAELMQEKAFEILSNEDLSIIGEPSFQLNKLEAGDDCEFSVEFEVRPQIDLCDFKKMPLELIEVDVSEQDAEQFLMNMRVSQAGWSGKKRNHQGNVEGEVGTELIAEAEGDDQAPGEDAEGEVEAANKKPVSSGKDKNKADIKESTETDIDASKEKAKSESQEESKDESSEEDVVIELGDRVCMDIKASLDGKVDEDYSSEDSYALMGNKQIFPEIEELLLGNKVGDVVKTKGSFLEDESKQGLEFALHIKKIEVPLLPIVNEQYIARIGFPPEVTPLNINTHLKEVLQQQSSQSLMEHKKNVVVDSLVKKHDFPLPEGILAQEKAAIKQNTEREQLKNAQDGAPVQQLTAEQIEGQATRQLKYSLILYEVMQYFDIKVADSEVQAALRYVASRQKEPENFYERSLKNAQYMRDLQFVLMESQAIDKIVECADVTFSKVSYHEFMTGAQRQ